MNPFKHLFYGFFFSLILFFLFNLSYFSFGIVFISSFLIIDLDHYLVYLFHHKKFSPLDFWKYSLDHSQKWKTLTKEEKAKYKYPIFFFHSIEFLIILLILSLIFPVIYLILSGFIFHLFLDYVDLMLRKEPIYSKTSFFFLLQKNKNKKTFTLK